jgi:hypothetical protein
MSELTHCGHLQEISDRKARGRRDERTFLNTKSEKLATSRNRKRELAISIVLVSLSSRRLVRFKLYQLITPEAGL